MRLVKLIETVPGARLIGGDCDISRIDTDSRQAGPGSLFICIRGVKVDRHDFAGQVAQAGAAALVVEQYLEHISLPQVLVEDARAAWSYLSAAWFGFPQQKLRLIGVTGTKGKTTTTSLVKSVLEAQGHKCGLIGTVANKIGDTTLPQHFTTPDPYELYELLDRMVKAQCEYCIMEVSAHALYLRKLKGLRFAVGAFTNLSQDHLDDFKTMENYAAAKALLFQAEMIDCAVINADDPASGQMLSDWHGPTVTYSARGAGQSQAVNAQVTLSGIRYDWMAGGSRTPVELKLGGAFNVDNSLAAATICLQLGLSMQAIAAALGEVEGIDGRLERVQGPMAYTVIVDYAHSPASLENVLQAVRPATRGRLICVFGCGGNRDPIKRPIMGRIGSELADYCILTTDNPRYEDPDKIIDEIESGARQAGGAYERITDRAQAICRALDMAQRDDTVLICGKGHETYQEIGGVRHDFDDRLVVRKHLGLA